MSTFIAELSTSGDVPRVAVKDLIDIRGLPTTAGSRARANAPAAEQTAACLLPMVDQVTFAGKTNLNELALGADGENPWFGTPVNPYDPERIPGGSSSGSAVAVASETVDIGIGTDTGGSIRIPAACCGVVGLKTTIGRLSCEGVYPLSPTLDTVGPIARDVTTITEAMCLLEPGFITELDVPSSVGRVRGLPTSPEIERALDEALAIAEIKGNDVNLAGWSTAVQAARTIIRAEAWHTNASLVEANPSLIGKDVLERLAFGREIAADRLAQAYRIRSRWVWTLTHAVSTYDILVCPTLLDVPPKLKEAPSWDLLHATMPINLAGLPAISLPLRGWSHRYANIQLVAGPWRESSLIALARHIERAWATR